MDREKWIERGGERYLEKKGTREWWRDDGESECEEGKKERR